MSALQSLRNAHLVTRLVLVWFALFIGVSVASPLVKPQASQMVCSAMGGMKMVTGDDAGDSQASSAGMQCPACLPLMTLPPVDGPEAVASKGLTHVLPLRSAARMVGVLGQPRQARAPPAIFA